ncbi:MAG: hypothetical protein R3F11_09960 [Verrucomicrobiales bacterium]
MLTDPTSRDAPTSIARQLRAARGALARWIAVAGAWRVIAAALAVAALSLLLDWRFHLDLSQRAIMLVLMLAAFGYALWRFLLKPMRRRLTDEGICHEYAKHDPEAAEQMLAALEFSKKRPGDESGASPGMVAEAIEAGGRAGEKADFSVLLRADLFRQNAVLLAVLGLLGVGAVVFCAATKAGGTWLNRNLLLGRAEWPQPFFLDIEGARDGRLTIPRGDDYTLVARVRDGFRALPESVSAEIRSEEGGREESMDAGDGQREFRLPLFAVGQPFEVRLTSDRYRGEWVQVNLAERPELVGIELTGTPPEYTGEAQSPLGAGGGAYYLLAGTALGVSGEASKPLASADLVAGERRFPLGIEGGRFTGEIAPEAVAAGHYTLELVDAEGLSPREPARFAIRLREDKRPKIKAEFAGVGSMIGPRALLPYSASIEDDYGVASVALKYEWRRDAAAAAVAIDAIADPDGGADAPGGAGADAPEAGEGEVPLALAEGALPGREVAVAGKADVESLGAGEGMRLQFQFHAADNNDISGPGEGESSQMIFRIVPESELRADLLRREREQRLLLEELIKRQDLLLTDCQAVRAGTRDAPGDLPRDARTEVATLQKNQKLLAADVAPVAERIVRLLEEIANNRLEEGVPAIQSERLREKVLAPLAEALDIALPAAALALDAARRSADPSERDRDFADAANAQAAAIDAMRRAASQLVENESFQQAVNLLYEIQKSQEEVNRMTDKEKEERLKGVLEK